MKAPELISEMFLLRLVLGILIFNEVVSSEDKVPPSIVQEIPRLKYFKDGQSIYLHCSAKGSPNLAYDWKKDGKYIRGNTSNIKLANGYLNITSATKSDEGYYQCFVKNNYGTACTSVSNLRYAMINVDNKASSKPVACSVGERYQLNASTSKINFTSVPDANYSWSKGNDTVNPSERIQLDDAGTLYFAHVLPNDAPSGGMPYTLTARNEYAKGSVIKVSYTMYVHSDGNKIADFLEKTDICKPSVNALAGSSARLRCFFYGYPQPTLTWTDPRGQKVQKLSNFDTELEIPNVSFTDEGNYTCTASNTKETKNYTIQLLVEEAPRFAKDSDHPYDRTVKVGENLTFNCNAEAKPVANVTWYKDGIELNVAKPPPRFEFSSDNKSLTILNVCSNCSDRKPSGSDMMVIQCNASNVHGYAFRNGYVIVVDPKPTSESNKTGMTNWIILLVVGLGSFLLVQ